MQDHIPPVFSNLSADVRSAVLEAAFRPPTLWHGSGRPFYSLAAPIIGCGREWGGSLARLSARGRQVSSSHRTRQTSVPDHGEHENLPLARVSIQRPQARSARTLDKLLCDTRSTLKRTLVFQCQTHAQA
jgi:hypothetical protein